MVLNKVNSVQRWCFVVPAVSEGRLTAEVALHLTAASGVLIFSVQCLIAAKLCVQYINVEPHRVSQLVHINTPRSEVEPVSPPQSSLTSATTNYHLLEVITYT